MTFLMKEENRKEARQADEDDLAELESEIPTIQSRKK